MDLLEALNRVLRGVGKESLNDLDDEDMRRGDAEEVLNRTRKEILANGYDFNTDLVDLQPLPAEGGKVAYPTGFLFVGFNKRTFNRNRTGTTETIRALSFRHTENSDGNQQAFIFDLNTRTFVVTAVADVCQVFDIFDDADPNNGFDRIPDLMAQWISRKASAEYYYEVNQGPSQTLEAKAAKAMTKFINRHPFSDIHTVTGFRQIEAIGAGGSTSTFDVRTQS